MKIPKKYSFYIFIFLTVTLVLSSCYKLDDGPAYVPPVIRSLVHSERDFLADTNLYSLPGEVIVVNLEHLNTPADSVKPGTDTDGIGLDIVPFKLKDTANISFRIDTTTYIIEMYDKENGQKVLTLNKDIRQRIRRYPPSDYLIHLTSLLNYDDDTLNYQLIFIQPDVASNKNSASNNENEIFWFMQSRLRACEECNLKNFNFSGFDLTMAELNNSQLNNSILKGTVLYLADLSNADLSYCDLSNADLPYSNLYNALMEYTVLNYANLKEADLEYADLTKASLRHSNAIGANFCNTIRTGWDTTGIVIDSTTLCLP